MKVNLITDKGCFGVSLRSACLSIAISSLTIFVLGVICKPSYLFAASSLIGFIISILGNLSLLFGVLRSNQWLVVVWLINAILFFVGWPIAVLGVIFNFGNYREMAASDNVFVILLEYILFLALYLYCSHLVYSYFHQLRNESKQDHSIVI